MKFGVSYRLTWIGLTDSIRFNGNPYRDETGDQSKEGDAIRRVNCRVSIDTLNRCHSYRHRYVRQQLRDVSTRMLRNEMHRAGIEPERNCFVTFFRQE